MPDFSPSLSQMDTSGTQFSPRQNPLTQVFSMFPNPPLPLPSLHFLQNHDMKPFLKLRRIAQTILNPFQK